MAGEGFLFLIFALLCAAGIWEWLAHKANLARIPVRIHVNGTRGKSSVVRLIAGGIRESGTVTCAKTTGTLARMILPDASEYPIFRPAGANVIEQVRIVSVAASCGAGAFVLECMALQPHLQWLSESKFLRATHGVITNVRADHLDVMGPEENDVALALAGTTPKNSKLFTAERKYLPVFERSARDRRASLIGVTAEDVAAIRDADMAGFSYVEHKENVALALSVCRDLGIDRETALRGMWKAPPDPGVLTMSHLTFFGRDIYFVNAFAANDPESSEQLWNMAIDRYPQASKRIIIFNCRSDRPNRSEQLGAACPNWREADHYLLMGSGTYFLARAAVSNGLPMRKIITAENEPESEIFEKVIELAGESTLVAGLGNTKGRGLGLARYFRNRSELKKI
ncbi:MAG: poly-gamma-glutamate synthase PgsB [Syntrophaceae bacterium]